MTAAEFKFIRLALGLSQEQFGRALGNTGKNVRREVYLMEQEQKSITARTARLAEMFRRYGVPPAFLE